VRVCVQAEDRSDRPAAVKSLDPYEQTGGRPGKSEAKGGARASVSAIGGRKTSHRVCFWFASDRALLAATPMEGHNRSAGPTER
jgi:hypothetical protein